MASVNLYTTLSTIPSSSCSCSCLKNRLLSITRGASATFSFSFLNKDYTFEKASQIIFAFKQGRTIHQFSAISYTEEGWNLNKTDDYEFTLSEDQQTLTLKLGKHITKLFKSTEANDNYINFEVIIELENNSTLIESQPQIVVKNSIYGDVLSDTAVYCGEDTICSEDTICNG